MSQLSDLLETMGKRGENPAREFAELAGREEAQERAEAQDVRKFVLRKMSGVRPHELPSYRAENSKHERENQIRQVLQRLDRLSKNSGSSFHSELATEPASHPVATEQSAAALPKVDTSRSRFEPRAIAAGTLRDGEGLQAAMVRLARDSETVQLPNTQQRWPETRNAAESARAASDVLPDFIRKIGKESLRCERCNYDFRAMAFGPRPLERVKSHLRLCHSDGSVADSLSKSAARHDFASTYSAGRVDRADELAKSGYFRMGNSHR